ncbi:WW domain binding protein WBP-2, contains GRAM domain [Plasmopara halstedii]|uniref:WW domain binding protein WBP-2, contains GRAM domain n=1 Tax=Plasmopara halstedii TaxID=4781 RepID=A0A0P1AKH2_PLAHL|nr:WW domain binding protein WBP-2, contains GRAM domain [Plasmopara halstedii]CEG41762.1 WW domain binding protein WBP-2, contains GRAM domain [Plasmopara halstedii]|eukprot:XP_024578131.1 WW domain binding protein WBP-2, contains GRAM domain [Plasmopara halstedii]
MSINVQLHEGAVPILVSPYENFFFLIYRVKLTVESGNGYPGQGGCFYSNEGRCYISQYRLVFVSSVARDNAAYQSFSLPFYGIRDWSFDVSLFGKKFWKGHVNPVPGGGLVGVGKFIMEFLSYGFDEFRNHVLPLLANSRSLHQQFRHLTTPSVLLVPGELEENNESDSRRLAYCSAEDPMTLFIVSKALSSQSDQ